MNDSATGRVLFYAFAISVLLIIVVYFIGLSTDLSSFASAARSLIYSVTGRNSSGQFATYPSGATLPAGVAGAGK